MIRLEIPDSAFNVRSSSSQNGSGRDLADQKHGWFVCPCKPPFFCEPPVTGLVCVNMAWRKRPLVEVPPENPDAFSVKLRFIMSV